MTDDNPREHSAAWQFLDQLNALVDRQEAVLKQIVLEATKQVAHDVIAALPRVLNRWLAISTGIAAALLVVAAFALGYWAHTTTFMHGFYPKAHCELTKEGPVCWIPVPITGAP